MDAYICVTCVILLIVFNVFGFICLLNEEPIASTFAFIFALIVGGILIYTLKNPNESESNDIESVGVIYDVIDYQIDTNIIINDADTLKTYTINYLTN